ncbi:MAG: GntR family transcriptional regulator [Chloroflexi bacterium]|jgi:GntR family transcriptional regulator|nr:GntR family transcriptional regulator [Chloroflexota bacterium]MBT7080963.1 GntR family transcriptional regulator [Chloroflexota bacterium]MBT7290084.1 GntR family transcriptional regulator [Chloroflexota bacterium]
MLISIDEQAGTPIYLQIMRQVKQQVQSGQLKSGDELPSVRDLAGSLSINLHTVRAAYQKLRELGIINMRLGRRARVAKQSAGDADSGAASDKRLAGVVDELKSLIIDAYLSGVSADRFRTLVNKELEQIEKQGM